AIRSLELVGLVEPRQGAGTVVREVSAESLVNPLTIVLARQQVSELLAVRKMTEPPLAARAATHASVGEITEMEEILRRQDDKVRRGELAIEEDSEFHYNVAMASDNSVVLKVLDVLMDLLRETRERSLQVEGRPQKSLAGHRRILMAIAQSGMAFRPRTSPSWLPTSKRWKKEWQSMSLKRWTSPSRWTTRCARVWSHGHGMGCSRSTAF